MRKFDSSSNIKTDSEEHLRKKILKAYTIGFAIAEASLSLILLIQNPWNFFKFEHLGHISYLIFSSMILPWSLWKKGYKMSVWLFLIMNAIGIFSEVFVRGDVFAALTTFAGLNLMADILVFSNFGGFFFDNKKDVGIAFLMHDGMCLFGIIVSFSFFKDGFYSISTSAFIELALMTLIRMIATNANGLMENHLRNQRIQELKKLNEENQKIFQEKEKFFAGMSHELRNPLNSVIGCLDILSANVSDSDQEILEIAQICSETLLNLIGNVLDVSKLDARKLEIIKSPSNLSELLQKLVAMNKTNAGNKGIFIKLLVDEKMPSCLEFDNARLMQVLMNIIGNGIKFTKQGGIIIIAEWHESQVPFELLGSEDEKFRELLGSSERESAFHDFEEIIDIPEEGTTQANAMPLFNCTFSVNKKNTFVSLETKRHIFRKSDLNCLELCSNKRIEEIKESENILESFSEASSPFLEHLHAPFFRESIHGSGYVKIQIIDSGIGISEANLQKLFQPFIQAESTTFQNFGGTGLGLWISKEIIRLMKGDIKIDSEVGRGTNFIVVAPMKKSIEIVEELKEDECNMLALKGIQCLYVEDQKSNQIIMKEMLERNKMEIMLANNGKEGLNLFKLFSFDLILTDLRMPVMSGQQMIRQIRKNEKENHLFPTPILVITGDPSENEKDQCLSVLKVNSFINKPVKINTLKTQIFNAIKSRKQINIEVPSIIQEKKSILLIEDDKFVSEILYKFITDLKADCIQSFSIKEAKKAFKNNYDKLKIIILDSNLPDGSGSLVAEYIRKFERKHKVSNGVIIISMSGHSRDRQSIDFENVFVNYFVEKPVKRKELYSIIKQYI